MVDDAHVRAHMEFLASDALAGRGSATEYEHIAATYIASELRQYGLAPAGDKAEAGVPASYLQRVPLPPSRSSAPPLLQAGKQQWEHGKQIAVIELSATNVQGPLQKWDGAGPIQRGAFVLVRLREDGPSVREQLIQPLRGGAAAVLVADAAQIQARFKSAAGELPQIRRRTLIFLNPEASKEISALAEGEAVTLSAPTSAKDIRSTWNVVAKLEGSGPESVLLSAHLDHLGTDPSRAGDNIFNGADDDASGVTAVLELARILGQGPKPRRTVYFVLFGSEETGGQGASFFLEHPPIALPQFAAALEFEMIGRADSAVARDQLWLTGYDRSDLGPELAKHGARLVADPHPAENFFQRSDNFAMAKRGIVAHTVSSFGLHAEYHQPNDDLAHIDFKHMVEAIQSMAAPVRWLADSDFKPKWKRPVLAD